MQTFPHPLSRLDRGAEGLEALHDIFVSAVDRVDIAERGAAFGGEHRDEDDGRGPERRRADNLGGLQVPRAFYRDAMRVVQARHRTEAVQLGVIDGALFIRPIVDEGRPLGLRRDNGEEGQVINVESRVGARVNLLGEGDELGRFYMNIF